MSVPFGQRFCLSRLLLGVECVGLQIVTYPHPTLRHDSKAIKRVDSDLRAIVREMFELMYEARGVGLAANQVGLPIRLFVANLESDADASEELVFINPVISRPKGSEESDEGCLSLPDLYGPVKRPKNVRINAYGLDGREIVSDLEGLFSRVAQHETDHLDGVLFVDRMSETARAEAEETLGEFEADFLSKRSTGEIDEDETIAARLAEWEARYC